MIMSPFIPYLLGGFCIALALAQTSPTVRIQSGAINGTKCPTTSVYQFLGIPFAQPPVGDLRFAPPVAFQGNFTSGSLAATQEPLACIQFGSALLDTIPQSEDCLYLNVWVPANATSTSGLPVKVWIYGGGEENGFISDPLYDGCYLATDSVVVSVAYRLGPLGFLALESAGIGGNFGVQDILLGLQWVQSNIAAFGGDPKKVLLFGESAGAQLVWYLSTLPQSTSLINAVIGESGTGQPLPYYAEYQAFGESYAATLGCNVSDIGCFRSKSTAELNISTPLLPTTYIETLQRFQPFLDGKIIPVDPLIVGSKVPLIAGSNTMEGTLFTIGQFTNPLAITQADYLTFLNYTFGSLAVNVSNYYPMSAFESTDLPGFYAISAVLTDSYFKCPAYRALLATIKAGVPAWTYLFDHTPSCGWAVGLNSPTVLELLGPTHSSEIPFVFGEVTNLPPPAGTCSFNAQEVGISNVFISAWTSMAEGGSPGSGAGIVGGPWPQFSANGSQGLVIENGTAVGYVNYTTCEFWDLVAAAQNSSAVASTGSGSSTASSTSNAPGPSSTSRGTSASSTSSASGPSSTSGATRMASPVISEPLLIAALFAILGFIL